MTGPGQLGRSAPGEAWRRAMQEVADRVARGAKSRYRVYGRRVEAGWWTYDVRQAKGPTLPSRRPAPMTSVRIARLSLALPRCAQRSRANHGGNSKVAWPSQILADEVAEFLGVGAYECPLAAPAIGKHWHLTTSGKGRRK